jgi:outer membrane protein OmpA-like peptidoglycan-associated protein/anti-anti-sigma regulatory factor
MPLSLQTANGIQVATLNGPLDQAAGTAMVTTIKSSVEKGTPLILDFTAVPEMDGNGFRQLLALKRWADQGNSRLILAGMNTETWALVVENNCTSTFEAKPSMSAAMQALSADGFAGGAIMQDPVTVPGNAVSAFETEFNSAPEADSGVFSKPPASSSPPPSTEDPWGTPTVGSAPPANWDTSSSGSDGWERFEKGTLGDGGSAENERRPGARKGLYVGLSIAAALLLAGIGWWAMDAMKLPEIRLDETAIETQAGKELPPVSIWVKYVVLDDDNLVLPSGIDVVDGEMEGDQREYLLTGTPKKPGKQELTFVAVRENNPEKKSPSVSMTLSVSEVKLEWQQDDKGVLSLNSVGLMISKPLPHFTVSKVVTGAAELTMEWMGANPGGISLLRIPNTESSWQLAGTPEHDGSFKARFVAKKLSGETESKVFDLTVKPLPLPPPPPPPPVTQTIQETKIPESKKSDANKEGAITAKTNNENNVMQKDQEAPETEAPDPVADEKMRGFLLERIEKANSHFTDNEKNQLRLVVNSLREVRLLGTIHFKANSSDISRLEEGKLLKGIKDPAVRKLLDDEDCQIFIVGYADKSGKLSHNIRLSKLRAREVDLFLKKEIGRRADLCGDYGPTDLLSEDASENRAVEIYAGTIKISGVLEDVADKFKEDFNKRHGLR